MLKIGEQVFFLADDGQSHGKGANAVVSQVHHYLNTYGLGEQHAHFQCDNCCGQNKNNIVIWFTQNHHTKLYVDKTYKVYTRLALWHLEFKVEKCCLMSLRLWGYCQGRATTSPSLWGTLPILLLSKTGRITFRHCFTT
ncbi:uncharacterized protein LOC127860544 isoform X2 [Dreissena polymorpha]|uniref:uncharacterized protein LOC127860544 isoform X2 n=1 Tax=Dreissena polymorpha TaxID=45954 RepID=UPI002264DB31|nr:uncharacterized protein LOC127860544 isoform X2 [Dreissena polymorpha]